jgi:hypothetical protein
MREVHISNEVLERISELDEFLGRELGFSKIAARKRSDRMREFTASLRFEVDYPPCRFKRWRASGYRCAVFEKEWIFAYEVFDDGIIVRDMANAALLMK